ncbi:MAG: ADP-ribosylglycohydrolase [Caldanaerobacter subterraneus]|uniref:ADP-ribosylglycohydrolase family protein n=1 Tax=Caldanaerobacter subterraneus TaxID=911092 RepID=A0A124FCJ8_9THEO|nr:ADP-ribosylglycohydrolase family protein [Caldanaerobacter subterraneus]KUK08901.1 MAG: ADP-ribosylglycohydrolase [Caldanaerobacter subterraneus]HBT50235.1 ADP-ribosylglycohydrolase family protein [Caldanaerobacter subterraneus]
MKKAWEYAKEILENNKPKILTKEEQTWNMIEMLELHEDERTKMLWKSYVPGSGAEESLIVGAIQSVENKGMDVKEAEELLPMGFDAFKRGDMKELNKITSKIFNKLYTAPRNPYSEYWKFKQYTSWEEYRKSVTFTHTDLYNVFSRDYENKVAGGWIAQICGGALGTALEGYTTKRLKEVFGEIRGYVRTPNTFNDDITYELAFLKAFEGRGYNITSEDIALEWVALIPFGWSAEDVALRNLKQGIFPPNSGNFNNPYSEWIGAQMRGAICGMVAPGNPEEAARLAWIDAVISHENNGVLGEVFNAVMVSLAFVEEDVRKIVEQAVSLIPRDSEYYSVVKYALDTCKNSKNWEEAWGLCEKKFEQYNWVHAYPNAAAEVVALWFGEKDFDETMYIIAMAGQDVDCNAAQIATILGIIGGTRAVGDKWTKPIGDNLETYMRGMKKIKISDLIEWTVTAVRRANSSKN